VLILAGTPVAKATHWVSTDAEARKPGERTGLDTPVVLAVNAEYSFGAASAAPDLEKSLSTPPGEYGRKAETQRN
jgi:hypothetical protein